MKTKEEIRIKAVECTALLLLKNTYQYSLDEKVRHYIKFFETYLLTGNLEEE